MENHLILTDEFLNKCFGCGRKFNANGVYDFYCYKKCEERDNRRIKKMLDKGYHPSEIMEKAIKRTNG